MGYTFVKGVRIKSLLPGAVVQLRLGTAAVKSQVDKTVDVKLLRQYEEGDKLLAVFEKLDTEENGREALADLPGEITISRYPNAPWKFGAYYVSLIGVDESTFTIQKATSPISTDVIGEAIVLIEKEADDVYGAEQLIALLTKVQHGKRVNTEVKALATQYANKLVSELSNLPPRGKE